jgi:hypothetical protein
LSLVTAWSKPQCADGDNLTQDLHRCVYSARSLTSYSLSGKLPRFLAAFGGTPHSAYFSVWH